MKVNEGKMKVKLSIVRVSYLTGLHGRNKFMYGLPPLILNSQSLGMIVYLLTACRDLVKQLQHKTEK